MKKFKAFRSGKKLPGFMLSLMFVVCSVSFIPRTTIYNPFYRAKPGKAILVNGEKIEGRFAFHHNPYPDMIQLYFYPGERPSKPAKFQQKDLRELTVRNPKDSTRFLVFKNVNDTLVCKMRNGIIKPLSREVFSSI